jgi:hypothetical protein
MNTIDPTTEEVITSVARATPADGDEAVEAASHAFEEGQWPTMYLEQRAKLLFRIADPPRRSCRGLCDPRVHGHGDTLPRLSFAHHAALLGSVLVFWRPLYVGNESELSVLLRAERQSSDPTRALGRGGSHHSIQFSSGVDPARRSLLRWRPAIR